MNTYVSQFDRFAYFSHIIDFPMKNEKDIKIQYPENLMHYSEWQPSFYGELNFKNCERPK